MGRKLLMAAVCLLVVGAAGAADQRWIAFSDQVTEASIGVLSSARDAVELEIELPGVALESVATEGGRFVRVEVPGLGRIGAVGEPALPALRRFIEIPDGARVEVDVQVLDRRVIDLAAEGMAAPVEPVQLPRPKCDCEEAREWRFSLQPGDLPRNDRAPDRADRSVHLPRPPDDAAHGRPSELRRGTGHPQRRDPGAGDGPVRGRRPRGHRGSQGAPGEPALRRLPRLGDREPQPGPRVGQLGLPGSTRQSSS